VTLLALDIGGTIGWALIDPRAERVTDHGQCGYFAPTGDKGKRTFPHESEYDAAVFAAITGITFGKKTNGRSVAIQAYRQGSWENEMAHRVGPKNVFHVHERKPKERRQTELAQLTYTAKKDWRDDEADAAWIGLKWARRQKVKEAK